MKKYITLLLILGTFCVSAQDKLSMYGQVTALNFNQFNFNLDARYKLRDYIYQIGAPLLKEELQSRDLII